jgi:hypothetical protein
MSLKIPVTPPGIDPGTVQLVEQRLNHYTTPEHIRYGSSHITALQTACNTVVYAKAEFLLSKKVHIKIYRTIISTVVLNGCETWSVTLGEGHGLRIFEYVLLRG